MSDKWDDLKTALKLFAARHEVYQSVKGTPSDYVPWIELRDTYSEIMSIRRELGIPQWLKISISDNTD